MFQALVDRDSAPWQLLSSAYAIEEARRNLAVKFPAALAGWPDLLAQVQIAPQPATPRLALDLSAKDQPIWAAAHLLTGDIKDFGPHMNRPADTGGVAIQTVGEYLAGFAGC